MANLNAGQVECLVFTFKEGLLSPVAHDLKLRVGAMEVDIAADSSSVEAVIDATSIEVVAAMKDGVENPGALSPRDRTQIADNIAKEVLHTKKHPRIGFRSKSIEALGDGYRLVGTLDLHGVSRDVSMDLRTDGERLSGELSLHQPDFAIKPFKAALGTLRVQADVRVRLSVQRSALAG